MITSLQIIISVKEEHSSAVQNLRFALKWGCADLAKTQIEKMSTFALTVRMIIH